MQSTNNPSTTATQVTAGTFIPWVLRPLPVVLIRPAFITQAAGSISDTATRKNVDDKLNVALKNEIKRSINVEDDALEKLVDGLKLDYKALQSQTIDAVIKSKVVPPLLKIRSLYALAVYLENREAIAGAPTIAALLQLAVPLADHPLFVTDIRQGKGRELLRISNLSENLVAKIDQQEKALESWNDLDWQQALDQKMFTPAQKETLFFSTELSRLSGEQYALVASLQAANVKTLNDLLKWDKSQWIDHLQKKRIAPPQDVTAETYAEQMVKNINATYPSGFFSIRIVDKKNVQTLARSWSELKALLKNNPSLLWELDNADVDWTGIKVSEQKTLAAKIAEVAAMLNPYRHLGLQDVLADKKKTVAQQQTEINRRVDALGTFLQNNASEDLRFVNLLDTAKATASGTRKQEEVQNGISWRNINAADQTPVRNQVLAYQRTLHLSSEYETVSALLKAGFDSSVAAGNVSYPAFVKRTGLSETAAFPAYQNATHRSSQIAHGMQLKKDAFSALEQGRTFQGVDPAFINDLKDIPGYADLFGNTSYCDCVHCRSIFSPGAYFTDLMYFIETNITNKAFAGKKKHPLRLDMRRPDLWTLRLSCENTDTLVPHLELVIGILENYLQHTLSVQNIEQKLSTDTTSISLPYHRPLESLRHYLSDWNTGLPEVYTLLNAAPALVRKETLRFSDEEWTALTSAATDISWIRFTTGSHTQMDAVDFLAFCGIQRGELDELKATLTAGAFSIARVKLSNDIQSDKEVVQGLSDALLDRIGRFLRLRTKTGYTITELDEILQCSKITQAKKFTAASLDGVARFKQLQEALGLSVESMMSVLDHIPERAMHESEMSLWDQLAVPAFTNGSIFPVSFHHAHFNKGNASDTLVDERLPALLNVLGIPEAELILLFEQYAGSFIFDNKGNTKLTAAQLSQLFAHVAYAKANQVSTAELSLVVNQLFQLPGADFRSLDVLEKLGPVLKQLNKLPFAIAEFFELLDPSVSRVSSDELIQVIADVQQSGARLFGTSVLSSLEGMSSEDVAAVFSAMEKSAVPLLAKEGAKYALTSAYTPGTDIDPFLPAALKARKAGVHAAFMAFHFTNLLPNCLASLAGLSPETTVAALAFAQTGWDAAALLQAFKTPLADGAAQQPQDLIPLLALANDLNRIGTLFNGLHINAADAWFIAQYPALFEIQDIHQLTLADVLRMQAYRKFLSAGALAIADGQNLLWQYHVRSHNGQALPPAAVFSASLAAVPVFAKALAALPVFTKGAAPADSPEALVNSPLSDEEIKVLAKQNNLDPILVRSVFLSQVLPQNAIDGMEQAFSLSAFCAALRIQGHSLSSLLLRDFDLVNSTAGMLWSALEDKYPDAAVREKKLSVYTDQLNMLQRDALCAYIIARSSTLKFKDRDELYNYFLIDVEMAGCFRTSRLVAALSSLQLYVYRCLINLEQSESDKLSVLALIDSDGISSEWEWRKNYRVWEANRKVFLYPENYMEPELRDDKTPLFKELEDNLLQRTITPGAAEEAYNTYLTGFSEVAQLKIAGSYFDRNTANAEKECYYFFGRTHHDPYQYYFRRYYTKSGLWEPWVKTDLAISAPNVSPIVHLGRLYIFWMEIISMDKSEFVEGSSLFKGVAHKVTLLYSHLQENNRWAPAQKKVFLDELLDRAIVDITPPFFKELIDTFRFATVDKDKTAEAVKYYRASKTYAKVFVTSDNNDAAETLTVHYYRKRKRTHVVTETEKIVVDKNGKPVLDKNHLPKTYTDVSDPLPDSELDNTYIDGKGGKVVFKKPNPVAGFQYYKRKIDILRNELVSIDEVHNSATQQTTEAGFYNASKGVQSIGMLSVPNAANPEMSYYTLMLRSYARPENPGATDDMLITEVKENGVNVSNGVNALNVHDMQLINNCDTDTIMQTWKNQHWIHLRADGKNIAPHRTALRINTTLASYLSKVLFTQGVDKFLSLETQTTQGETLLLTGSTNSTELAFASDPYGRLPFTGSFGQYYRELFFHIPFLVANHLNADGKYKEAKSWYEKIFNPAAQPSPSDTSEKDRVWRYFEFRDISVPKLKEILADKSTIEQYKKDPFNPFAIARLRMSAFQKCIVMKYIDNLIDWADDLFTQDTMESINEATMLYVLAYELLGKRPVSIGACESANETALTYGSLGPAIKKGSEFLMYIENVYLQVETETEVRRTMPLTGAVSSAYSANMRSTGLGSINMYRTQPRFETYASFSAMSVTSGTISALPSAREKTEGTGSTYQALSLSMNTSQAGMMNSSAYSERPEASILRQYLPAFCVPPNENLLAYWDRLEDRLFKIRNCMNIDGEYRSLALFQPPIDPMLLVRAKAAGLSIEDIISQLNETLPPYRFTYLVEKARQYLGTVQSFGSALLSALEKKDGETLTLLRSVHEQNILSMTRSVKKQQIEEANTALQGLYSTQQNVQNRVDYYSQLLATGLNTWEALEQDSKLIASGIRIGAGVSHLVSTIFFATPQIGSPFAMKYGGKELGDSAKAAGAALQSTADVMDNISVAAGMIAHNQRRAQEWEQQLKLAQEELNQVAKQIIAAEIRVSIAEKDLEIHEKQIEQAQELHDFYSSKFSNVGLYKFMSTQLSKLYREAYQMATQLARQAERAFQFERDSTDFFIQGDNWQSDKSGLLSGERLLLQLQRLEKAYMEQNYREMEVSQSFSLQQFNPQALQDLKSKGSCSFDIPEILFDMYYPGHYRRLVKAVRITMPCVAGPYTNIGAKLTLNSSKVRRTPQANAALDVIPVTMVNSIATSQAQNDAGVFELNFRDERYLPFEGAGAVSSWTLDLPSKVRMFNYDSLSDVIMHISYVAKHDDAFGAGVETNMMDTLKSFAGVNGLSRMISLRHEFPDTFYQLMNGPLASPQHSSFLLESKHFAAWLNGLILKATGFDTWLKPVKGQTIAAVSTLKINSKSVSNWSADGVASVAATFNPQMLWNIDAGAGTLSKTTLDDIVILLKYELDPSNP